MNATVSIADNGREGHVTYREDSLAITGYQEFGGSDVVAIVSMGSVDEWRAHHAWAVDRRAQILRFVADEVLRQKALGCSAEIDEVRGNIVIRNSGSSVAGGLRATVSVPVSTASTDSAHWVFRFTRLKAKLGIIALVIALLLGAAVWIKTRVLVVEPGKGVPFGSTLRTDTHLVTLISQLQPYTPSLHHNSSTERFTLSVFLVPLDGSAPKLVRLVGDLTAGSYSLARVMGSDGKTMWIDANRLYGIDLHDYSVVSAESVLNANPGLDRALVDDTSGMDIADGRLQLLTRDRRAAYVLDPNSLTATAVQPQVVARQYSDPPLTQYMAAGVMMRPITWIGLQSRADLDGAYRPGRWLRAIESASDAARESRRLINGDVEGDSDETHWQIRSITPINETEYRNASFLRLNEKSEPLRLSNPESVLMLYTSGGVSSQSTLLVARVEIPTGRLVWSIDTGIDRFKLAQILPGERTTAFVGTRPPVPNTVSEPMIVMLEHATGAVTTHSLWQ